MRIKSFKRARPWLITNIILHSEKFKIVIFWDLKETSLHNNGNIKILLLGAEKKRQLCQLAQLTSAETAFTCKLSLVSRLLAHTPKYESIFKTICS